LLILTVFGVREQYIKAYLNKQCIYVLAVKIEEYTFCVAATALHTDQTPVYQLCTVTHSWTKLLTVYDKH